MSLVQLDESGQELTPTFLRRRGLRTALAAEIALRNGDERAAELARRAIADLVEAFLHDRTGNSDLFARAHRVGALLSATAGCFWTPGPETYTLRCPIYAHQTWATSVAMTVTTRCSICGAGELQCDHLPGETYDGEECRSVAESFGRSGTSPSRRTRTSPTRGTASSRCRRRRSSRTGRSRPRATPRRARTARNAPGSTGRSSVLTDLTEATSVDPSR